jgi:hypothetical protein
MFLIYLINSKVLLLSNPTRMQYPTNDVKKIDKIDQIWDLSFWSYTASACNVKATSDMRSAKCLNIIFFAFC